MRWQVSVERGPGVVEIHRGQGEEVQIPELSRSDTQPFDQVLSAPSPHSTPVARTLRPGACPITTILPLGHAVYTGFHPAAARLHCLIHRPGFA